MAVVQGIQSKQFALEHRPSASDDSTVRRAQLAVADVARRCVDRDVAGALAEVLDALGLRMPEAGTDAITGNRHDECRA
jgi:hypothetical protein